VPAISQHYPLFAAYVIAAAVSILNVVIPRLTIPRLRNPRGAGVPQQAPPDPTPTPRQVTPDERLERIRRDQQGDLTLMLLFLISGLVFVVLRPPPFWFAGSLLLAYLAAQALYFAVSLRAQTPPEARLAFRMLGALILIPIIVCAGEAVKEAIEDL
jgi:hypothetical protein